MPRGLKSSIWASPTRKPEPHRYDSRSRSVPPQSPMLAPTTMTTMTTTTTTAARYTSATAAALSPVQAFHRFEQACQRLRWKYIDLETSYKRAMNPEEWNFSVQDAERNFKVDFHEFYVWIEQALVLVLLVFGVVVSRGQQFGGEGRPRSHASHAYHHNVLKALDEEENPLYGVLGRGDVNHALWKAKELRNRWKDAAEGRETPPLKMYDLTWIVGQVLGGLEVAYGMAAARVEEVKTMGNESSSPAVGEGEGADAWEWMVEPMDWEA